MAPQETASLLLRVDSDQVVKGDKALEHMSHTAESTEKATDGLIGSLKELALAYVSIEGATRFLEKLFDTTKEFQVLEAQIRTATGSVDIARVAFEALQEFAGKTPFTLTEVTNAFTKLTNLGLNPSEEALKSYGNLATALNISLESVTDAVAQASQGQFRGLTALGVKMTETENGIALTFRGVTTNIKKDVNDLQGYLIALGQNNFAGAMAERAKTLEGGVSDLKKAWDELFISISKAGAGDLLASGIKETTVLLQELTAEVASGELVGYIKAIEVAFSQWGTVAQDAITSISLGFNQAVPEWRKYANEGVNWIIDAFKQMPENVIAVVQASGASLGLLVQYADVIANGMIEILHAAWTTLVNDAKSFAQNISLLINPNTAGAGLALLFQDSKKNADDFGKTAFASLLKVSDGIDNATEAWQEEVTSILDARDTTIKATDDQIAAAKKLRAEYEANKKARDAAGQGKDPLAGLTPPRANTHILTEQEALEFKALQQSLQLQEVTIQKSYQHRLDLIRNNTMAGSQLQIELTKQLDAQVTEEYAKAFSDREDKIISLEDALNQAIADGRLSLVDDLRVQLEKEESLLAKSYDVRRKQILDDTTTTEAQKLILLTKLENKYAQQQIEQDRAAQKVRLGQAADFFGNLSSIASVFGKKGFEAAKALSIVQATIKTYESAVSAYSSLAGIPYVGPVLGAAAAGAAIAAGLANVAKIKSSTYAGGFDSGGMIPAGKYGIAGEHDAEFVQGPAVVTSRRTTADLLQGGGKGSIVNVNITNNSGAEITTQESDGPDGKVISILIDKAVKKVAGDIRQGGGPVSAALGAVYQLRRGAA